MENKYDPKEIIEIIENGKRYLYKTKGEAISILSEKTPRELLSDLDSLLKTMANRTICNKNLFDNIKKEYNLDEGDRIKFCITDYYFIAGIVGSIGKYVEKLDPKDPDYNKKVDNIKEFIKRDLTDRNIFYIIYSGFSNKAFKELKNKEKKSPEDYNYILQKISNDLMNTVENLLEYRIKNKKQFYNSLLEIEKSIYK